MKRFLVVLGVLNVVWVLVSLGGVVLDGERLTFWTQHLMASLLVGVILVPLLVFAHSARRAPTPTSPARDGNDGPASDATPPFVPPVTNQASFLGGPDDRSDATDPTVGVSSLAHAPVPPASRSLGRTVVYAISVAIGVWLFASLFGLFLDTGNLTFWTRSVMAAFIVTMLWTPVLVFLQNPMEDPALRSQRPSQPSAPAATSPSSATASNAENVLASAGVAPPASNAATTPPSNDTAPPRPSVGLREEGDTWPEWPQEEDSPE